MHQPRIGLPRRQRGIATLLIILMVGLAVSVTVVATVYSVRGAQSQQLTSHSTTAAQAAAWRGVEALRQYLVQVNKSVWPSWVGDTPQRVTGLDPLGVAAASVTFVHQIATDHYQVGANVTGQSGLGSALTTSTVQVVYDIAPGAGTPGAPAICHALPAAPMVFNGNLTYSGGEFGADQGTAQAWDYKNIVVAGNLSIEKGSTAKISGCVKGDVDITGGGLTDNGHIYSEGTIALHRMDFPSNTALWGRAISFDGGSGGPPNMAWAGAWQTDIYSDGIKIGTAIVGGKLLANLIDPNTPLPWTSGALLPSAGQTEADKVVVTLNDNTQFLLDLGQLTIDPTTGIATGATAASRQISGTTGNSLQDKISFLATGVAATDNALVAGSIAVSSGASMSINGTTWGQDVSLLNENYKFPTVLANGTLTTGRGTPIGTLTGGSNLAATSGNCSQNDGYPTVGTGAIAGDVTCSGGGIIDVSKFPAVAKVATHQNGTTPGLPGLPYCDASVSPVDTGSFKTTANYVYENVNGEPQLTIQHVNQVVGKTVKPLDGVYPLDTPTKAQQAILESLMTCSNTNDAGCRKILSTASTSYAFGKDTYTLPKGAWVLNGVTKFPPGVVWFDNAVAVTGNAAQLVDTIVNKGGMVVLPNSGSSLKLSAPNLAGASATCGGAVYPTNLCESNSPAKLATWKDENDTTHVGLPVANMAIITDNDLVAAGWTINGSVVLGGAMATGGATVNIQGSLTVGSNKTSDTSIKAGGIHISTPVGGDSSEMPICSGGIKPSATTPSATVMWSRYL